MDCVIPAFSAVNEDKGTRKKFDLRENALMRHGAWSDPLK